MIKIYHNPRCRKSRETLHILEEQNKAVTIVKYLEQPPTESELRMIIEQLGITPEQLIRKGETLWKTNFKGQSLSDDELIAIMVRHPKLIERPIVISDKGARIGRPPENVIDII